MLSKLFYRSLSFVFVPLCVWGTALVHSAELQPFLTLQVTGPNALVSLAEKFGSLIDPTDTSLKTQLAPFKTMPGINPSAPIGLALLEDDDSTIGVAAALFLPIRDIKTFNIPGMEEMVAALREEMTLQGNKYIISTPLGELTAYQKVGYFVIATEGADDFAAAADPKKVFAELADFTFGLHLDLDHLSIDTVESVLGQAVVMLAAQGMNPEDMGFDMDTTLDKIEDILYEISAFTAGLTIGVGTLDSTVTVQMMPYKGSETEEKIKNIKNVKTKLGAFLLDGPQTVCSWHILQYLTDSDIENAKTMLDDISESFMEGLREAIDEDAEEVPCVQAAEVVLEYVEEILDFFDEERLIDFTYALDADGTTLMALATNNTKKAIELDEQLFGSLFEIFGGNDAVELIENLIKRDYETVAGYSLSCLPDVLANLPEEIDLPDAVRKIPLTLYWAVKENEAIVYALGLDGAKTEKTLKAALTASLRPVQPKQTGVFALKPFSTLILNQLFPLMEKMGADASDFELAKKMYAQFAAVDTKIVVTTEFPGDACRRHYQVEGKLLTTCFQAFLQEPMMVARASAQRTQCAINMKQIGIALHTYHAAHGALPPLYTVDGDGKPLHSWRVLLLPYLEMEELYDQIHLDEPWNSEHNKQFHKVLIPVYYCRSNAQVQQVWNCTYSAIAGEAFVPAAAEGKRVGKTFKDVTAGLSNTMGVVEVAVPFCWMDPSKDMDLETLAKGINRQGGQAGSSHAGGANALMLDGSVRLMSPMMDAATLRTLGSIADKPDTP